MCQREEQSRPVPPLQLRWLYLQLWRNWTCHVRRHVRVARRLHHRVNRHPQSRPDRMLDKSA